MPLLLSKVINTHSAYAVWNIQETNQVLIEKAQEELPKAYHPTKLAEWIVGRILIRTLTAQFNIPYKGIEPLPTGKPVLIGSNAQISISHSFPMAAAMINLKQACGIDLERARAKLIAIQHKFINEQEQQYANDLDRLCAIWCGKEVLYKIYGRNKLSMKDETTITFQSDHVLTGLIHKEEPFQRFQIHYEALKDYFIAYSI